jgi:hypothetical protein
MYTETWIPGTRPELDSLFDTLRAEQYNRQELPLWRNYHKDAFLECSALSITFSDGEPFFCASILNRACWPKKAYRVMNRLWKIKLLESPAIGYTPESINLLNSQVAWLKDNTDCELYFMSKEASYRWARWSVKRLHEQYGVDFKTQPYQYLTCENLFDDSCWQHMIYVGNDKILDNWTKR